MRLLKLLIGFLLLPACFAATRCLARLLLAVRPDNPLHIPLAAWWLAGGFVFWLVLYYSLPRPTRSYVLAHELTHALWGVLMGARVSRIRVGKAGGSVTLSKTNFLIGLAPYFFPFYTMCTIVLYGVLSFFLDMRRYELFWIAAIGLTWGFHLTFTIATLMTHQTDITDHGRVFSYTVIYLFNVLGVCFWIFAVSPISLGFVGDTMARSMWSAYAASFGLVWGLFRNVLGWL